MGRQTGEEFLVFGDVGGDDEIDVDVTQSILVIFIQQFDLLFRQRRKLISGAFGRNCYVRLKYLI